MLQRYPPEVHEDVGHTLGLLLQQEVPGVAGAAGVGDQQLRGVPLATDRLVVRHGQHTLRVTVALVLQLVQVLLGDAVLLGSLRSGAITQDLLLAISAILCCLDQDAQE